LLIHQEDKPVPKVPRVSGIVAVTGMPQATQALVSTLAEQAGIAVLVGR
jgi:hypothetical protein